MTGRKGPGASISATIERTQGGNIRAGGLGRNADLWERAGVEHGSEEAENSAKRRHEDADGPGDDHAGDGIKVAAHQLHDVGDPAANTQQADSDPEEAHYGGIAALLVHLCSYAVVEERSAHALNAQGHSDPGQTAQGREDVGEEEGHSRPLCRLGRLLLFRRGPAALPQASH